MSEVRLQKAIADAGVSSRRKAEELMLQGKVSVNGQVIRELGTKVIPGKDVISVDGLIVDQEMVQKLYMVMHKPRGYVTTLSDPQGRKTVIDICPDVNERIYPVGRLDYLSEGLLLMTNDGDLANKIMHPSFEIEKVYEVKVFGAVTQKLLKTMRDGMRVDGQFLKPRSVRVIKQLPSKTWLEFRLLEGKNREIRKICEASGMTVDKLKRVAIGGLSVEGIAPGKYRMVSKGDLLKAIGMKDDGSKRVDVFYQSNKKSLRLSKKKFAPKGTHADEEIFKIFRKDTYFDSLEKLKVARKNKRRKEWEAQEQERLEKSQAVQKKRALKAKRASDKRDKKL